MDDLTEPPQSTDIQRLCSRVSCPAARYREIRQAEHGTAYRRWALLREISAQPVLQPRRPARASIPAAGNGISGSTLAQDPARPDLATHQDL